MDTRNINILVLAYLGDSIYEVYVRRHLINMNISNVNDLQTKSLNYVSAKAQAEILKRLMEINIFNDEELDIIKKGRNYKSSRHPKNCDVVTYKHATAFETLIGYLYLENKISRLEEIIELSFKEGTQC